MATTDTVTSLIKQIVDIINAKATKNDLNSEINFKGFLTNSSDLPTTANENDYYLLGNDFYIYKNGSWTLDNNSIIDLSDNTTDKEVIELLKNMKENFVTYDNLKPTAITISSGIATQKLWTSKMYNFMGIVYFEFNITISSAITISTAMSNRVIANIPTNYVPCTDTNFNVMTNNGILGWVTIATSGEIRLATTKSIAIGDGIRCIGSYIPAISL